MVLRYDRASMLARLRKKKRHFSRNKIVIVGWAGGGKSALLRALKNFYDPAVYVYFSAGDFMRRRADEIVKQRRLKDMRDPDGKVNMTLFGEWLEQNPEASEPLDRECEEQSRITGLNPCCVIEGRVPHTQVEDACMYFLNCDARKRAERRAKDDLKRLGWSEDRYNLLYDQTLMDINIRDQADKKRLDAQLPGCVWEKGDFDFVLENDEDDPNAGEKNAKLIVQYHTEWHIKVADHLILEPQVVSKVPIIRTSITA